MDIESSPNRCHVGWDLRLKPQRRRWNALRHHVDHGRLAAAYGVRDRARQLVNGVHKFTMTSERTREKVVTGRQQIAAMHAVFTIIAALELALGVPARIIADDDNKGQLSAHRSFDFGHVEPECTVPHNGEYRRLTIKEARRQCKGQHRPNGTGDGIDQPPLRLEEGLTPLRKLATVADQNG